MNQYLQWYHNKKHNVMRQCEMTQASQISWICTDVCSFALHHIVYLFQLNNHYNSKPLPHPNTSQCTVPKLAWPFVYDITKSSETSLWIFSIWSKIKVDIYDEPVWISCEPVNVARFINFHSVNAIYYSNFEFLKIDKLYLWRINTVCQNIICKQFPHSVDNWV